MQFLNQSSTEIIQLPYKDVQSDEHCSKQSYELKYTQKCITLNYTFG